jgi:hypothetical protein
VTTLGADTHGLSQIKIWLQKFRNGDLSSKDAPCTGRQPLTLGLQLAAFLQSYPFTSARAVDQRFLTSVPTIKEVFRRELGLKKFSRRWVPRLLWPPKKLLLLKH